MRWTTSARSVRMIDGELTYRRWSPRVALGVAVGTASALLLTLTPALAQAAPAYRKPRPQTQVFTSVAGRDVQTSPRAAAAALPNAPRTATAWPAATTGQVLLRAGQRAAVPGTAVAVTGAAFGGEGRPVAVRTEPQALSDRLGLAGVVLSLTGPAGSAATIEVDYSGWAQAGGGDWARRLKAVTLPACALSTPQAPGCADPQPVRSVNNARTHRLTITTPAGLAGGKTDASPAAGGAATAGTQVFAVTGGTGSDAGDYAATPPSASSTWQVANQTGAFTWSYPFRVPPAVNGPAPVLSIDYDSGSVDGRTEASNNQPSWIGEGHTLEPGYVERQYVPCAEDLTGGNNAGHKTGDLCWRTDNATLVLAGHSSRLVKDTDTGAWTLQDDDGSTIKRTLDGANDDNNHETWVLTTQDGTEYHFGQGLRSAGDTAGNSNATLTVPVAGNQPGEPCYVANNFRGSFCEQAWRWNLDYVVDSHDNTMSYRYAVETNNYGRDNGGVKTSYDRAGYLTTIEYGQRVGSDAPAPARVVFRTAERCVINNTTPSCDPGALTKANAGTSWPDVPFDLICVDGAAACTGQYTPGFFTRKRLSGITTQVRAGTGYSDVDSWTFAQSFPDPGDGSDPGLWLNSIVHTGLVGGSAAMPSVTFGGVSKDNRVEGYPNGGLDGAPPLMKLRVNKVGLESGGAIGVEYSAPQCVAGSNMPANEDTNTKLCFPSYFTPEGFTDPVLHYFHKYVVRSLTQSPGEGFQPALQTYYTYGYTGGTGLEGVPAWHYDDNDLTPTARRTWSDWRGYDRVTVKTGSASGPQTAQQFLYMRGMNGDRLKAGGTRSVSVTDSEGGVLVDAERLKGFVREQRTFNGVGGAEITGTISGPWVSTVHGSDALHSSTMLQTALVKGRRSTSSNGVQRTLTTTTFNDATGLASTIDDAADTSRTSDDLCTRLTYTTASPASTAKNLVDNVARTETVSVRCAATPSRPGQVVSDVRNFYDGTTTFGAAPIRGDITKSELLSDGPSATAVYKTKVRMTYDANGRTLDTYDALNRKSSLSYTPATGGPLTATTSTNPLGHTNTTRLDPARGDPVSELDSNNNKTELDYDPLGRLTAVWLPDRPRATTTANLTFSYLVRKSGATAVTTQTLEHDEDNGTRYSRSTALYDGLMRPVQTQTQAPLQDKQTTPGRLISDTTYDARGLVVVSNGPYYNTGPVGTDFFDAADNAVPTQTKTTYDGAGRPTIEQFRSLNTDRWRTTTSYGGDRVTVTPPAGGTAATTITDLRGQAVELRQYKTNPPSDPTDSATYNKTTYTYTPAGDLAHVTDPAGNDWSYDYDLRGRQISSTDPDSGTSTTGYDDADQPILTTDARGQALSTSYDALGRRTELRAGSTTGPLRASWTYDTLADGKATSSTRWDNGNAYTTKVTGYDSMYRPTGGTVTIPAAEGALAGTYTTDIRYNADDGSIRLVGMPAAGDLPSEYVAQRYNELGQPTVVTGLNTYVAGASYNPYGELSQLVTGSRYGLGAFSTYNYAVDTHQLSQAILDRESIQPTDADFHYTYDPAGNLQQITDSPVNGTAGTECFNYDYLRRLTQAWTTSSTCAATPAQAAVGGPAPYWQSYTYDLTGNRTSRVDHTAAGDTTATYTYPAPGQTRPHAVTGITTTTPTATRNDAIGYNAAGDTTTRNIAGKPDQSLTWDAEDHLATVTSGTGTTSYLYDADDSRLIRRDPTATTLYLDNTEIRLATTPGATPKGIRYYTHAGATVAVRTATTLTTLFTDPHGTAEFALDNSDNSSTRRRSGPFGDDRGTQPATWPTQQGFLGGTEDPTGLTHLGAREYDPARGRFISPDPIVAHQDPQRLNAYAYANNNPTTNSDPSGLIFYPGDGSGPVVQSNPGAYAPPAAPAAPAGGPGAGSPNGRDHRAGPPPTPTQIAHAKVTTAEGNKNKAKRQVQEAAIEIVRVISDEVGITAGLDCLTKGDISGCAETAVNILTAFAGGLAAKLLAKYGLPWKWAKAARLVRKLVGLADEALDGLRGWSQAGRELKAAERYATEAVTSCAKHSFTPDTAVVMADGTQRPLRQVQVGDQVEATDPTTGKTTARAVTKVWINYDRDLLDLTVLTGTGPDATTTVVHTTQEHPFWSASSNTWVNAEDLKAGEQLRTDNGTLAVVDRATIVPGAGDMWNLTVTTDHTFYVVAGTTRVLVHNCDGLLPQSVAIAEHAAARALDGDGSHFVRGVAPQAMGHYVDGVLEGKVPNVVARHGLANGRVGYFDPDKGSIIIEDGLGGTVFTPRGGRADFDALK